MGVGIDQHGKFNPPTGSIHWLDTDHVEVQQFLKWIEVPIIVEQFVSLVNAKGRRQAIDRAANRDSSLTQRSIVARRLHCHIAASGFEDGQAFQNTECFGKSAVAADSLQDFGQYQRRDAQSPPVEIPVQPIRLGRGAIPKIVDQNGRINNHRWGNTLRSPLGRLLSAASKRSCGHWHPSPGSRPYVWRESPRRTQTNRRRVLARRLSHAVSESTAGLEAPGPAATPSRRRPSSSKLRWLSWPAA